MHANPTSREFMNSLRLPLSILTFVAAFAIGFTPAPANADGGNQAFACCDSASYPSSCALMLDPGDLSTCDVEADVAWCDLEYGSPVDCTPVNLQCCQEIDGVVWTDSCTAHEPGMVCLDAVVAEIDHTVSCCVCDGGVPECYDRIDFCPPGSEIGPIVCAP
jgi:hypothetical protein